MRFYRLLLLVFLWNSFAMCQQAALSADDTGRLIAVLQQKPEYGELIDLMSNVEALTQSGASKKQIATALAVLEKRVRFVQKYSSDSDLDLIKAWCAAQTGKSYVPRKNALHDGATCAGRSVDDLALALSQRPEYEEIFELFVSVQVLFSENASIKQIRPQVYKLIKRVEFVQKYANDGLLSELLAWCYAQKGCGKRALATWAKVMIGVGMGVLVSVVGAYVAKRARQRNAAQQGVQQPHGVLALQPAFSGFVMMDLDGPLHHPGVPFAAQPPGDNQHLLELMAQFNAVAAQAGGHGDGGAPGHGVVTAASLQARFAALPETEDLGSFNVRDSDTYCPICYEGFVSVDDESKTACCIAIDKTHAFHQNCLISWLIQPGRTCPMCRQPGVEHFERFTLPVRCTPPSTPL